MFRKNYYFYPLLHIRTCAYQGVRNNSFRKILCPYYKTMILYCIAQYFGRVSVDMFQEINIYTVHNIFGDLGNPPLKIRIVPYWLSPLESDFFPKEPILINECAFDQDMISSLRYLHFCITNVNFSIKIYGITMSITIIYVEIIF